MSKSACFYNKSSQTSIQSHVSSVLHVGRDDAMQRSFFLFVRQIFEHSYLPLVLISGKYHKSEIWWAAFPLLAVIVKNGSNSATVC